jgi:hypothetical protein
MAERHILHRHHCSGDKVKAGEKRQRSKHGYRKETGRKVTTWKTNMHMGGQQKITS